MMYLPIEIREIVLSIEDQKLAQSSKILNANPEILKILLNWMQTNSSWVEENKDFLINTFSYCTNTTDESAVAIQTVFSKIFNNSSTKFDIKTMENVPTTWVDALEVAVLSGHENAVKVFLDNCKTPESKKQLLGLENVLFHALQFENFEVANTLIVGWPKEHLADLVKNNQPPLAFALITDSITRSKADKVLAFLRIKFPNEEALYYPNEKGISPFAICSDIKTMKALLASCPEQYRAKLYQPDNNGTSILSYAADRPVEILTMILRQCPDKANLYKADSDGKTPLQEYITKKNTVHIEVLLREFPNIINQELNENIVEALIKLAIEKMDKSLAIALIDFFKQTLFDSKLYAPLEKLVETHIVLDYTQKLNPADRLQSWISSGELDELRERYSVENSLSQWERYVNRGIWEKSAIYGNTGSQQPYGALMHQSIVMATSLVNKRDLTFEQLASFCAYRRQEMANILEHAQFYKFGMLIDPKSDSLKTEFLGPYKTLGNYLKTVDQNTVIGSINGENINLSSWTSTQLKHTSPSQITKILGHVETLYDKVKKEKDPEKVMELSGRIFWWICQSKPWSLGDPSIAEMIVRTLWNTKGIEQHAWKLGVIPWVETMKTFNEEDFAKNFVNLLDREFVPSAVEPDPISILDTFQRLVHNSVTFDKEAKAVAERFMNDTDSKIQKKAKKLQNLA